MGTEGECHLDLKAATTERSKGGGGWQRHAFHQVYPEASPHAMSVSTPCLCIQQLFSEHWLGVEGRQSSGC